MVLRAGGAAVCGAIDLSDEAGQREGGGPLRRWVIARVYHGFQVTSDGL